MSNFSQPSPNPMSSTNISGDGRDGGSGGGQFISDHTGEFRYGAGVSVGILLLITTITLSSYYCHRVSTPRPAPPDDGSAAADVEAGIDEATLMNYPKMLYSEIKLRDEGTMSSCCSICLADYKDSDVLRDLPDCRHLFHVKCVDPWLRLHPTCPICRTSPLPTPFPTPLAEVVPLARQS